MTDSNRTALDTWAGTVGACPDTTGTPTGTAPRTYDAAGRATLTGYTYDGLGRTRTLPAAESPTGAQVGFTYYGNDLAATLTTDTSTRAYGLDAVGRIASWTDTTNGTTGPTAVNHYADGSDSPVWTDLGDGTWTRAVTGISGELAAQVTGNTNGPTTTTAQVVDLHGDVVATLDNTTGANAVSSTTAYTEYGTPADGTTPGRYGWLGAKQRPTDTLTGIILMGVRLYNTVTGRFLTVDPIPGGSAGPYLYPTNPITTFDLNGKWWGQGIARGVGRWAWRNRTMLAAGVGFAACLAGPLACAAGQAFAYGVRAHKRIQTQGFRRSWRANLGDATVTVATFGLVRAPIYKLKSIRPDRYWGGWKSLPRWQRYATSGLGTVALAGANVVGCRVGRRAVRGWCM